MFSDFFFFLNLMGVATVAAPEFNPLNRLKSEELELAFDKTYPFS